MPELGKLKRIDTGQVRIIGVTSGTERLMELKVSTINWEGDPYDGDYTITPMQETQVLQTENKHMLHDVTINPIPSNYGLITWDGSTLTVS